MALYKKAAHLAHSNDAVFDQTSQPGVKAPRSGIYRCTGCGREVASNENEPLPPQNSHQHAVNAGPIRWQLIVYADHRPK